VSPGQSPPLRFRPKPRQGETIDAYVRRLAAANHLRFSYLRRYLGKRSYGLVDAARLAAHRPRPARSDLGTPC
jgi:hypothetical protein